MMRKGRRIVANKIQELDSWLGPKIEEIAGHIRRGVSQCDTAQVVADIADLLKTKVFHPAKDGSPFTSFTPCHT